MLVFGKQVKAAPAEGVRGADPAPLKVAPPAARLDGKRILAALVVENPTEQALTVVANPYGGAFPYGGDHPFTLSFTQPSPATYSGRLYPPDPPLPVALTFPARSRVEFTAQIDLKDWTWQGEPEVELTWGFHFVDGPSRGGKVKLRLPKR